MYVSTCFISLFETFFEGIDISFNLSNYMVT
jgi:hypothetical protein